MRLDDDLKYFEEPEFKEILEKYEAALAAGQSIYMDADDLTDVAEYYSMVLQDEEKADEAIDLALQLHPDAVDPQIFKARQSLQDGQTEKAQLICDTIDDQEHREVIFLRAELMITADKVKEATEYLLQAYERQTEDSDFFIYDAAYIFIDYNIYDVALSFAIMLEQIAPQWYKTWQLRADVCLAMGEAEQAKLYINRMLDVDPFSIEAWNWNAEAHSNTSDFNKAIEATDYALAIEPDNERALQLKAYVLLQQGNSQEAHDIYERLIQANPTCENHWLYDSYALYDMDKIDEAESAVRQAQLLADDDSADIVFINEQLAQVASCRGHVDEALAYLDRADELREDGFDVWDERMLRVRVLVENGRLKDALIEVHSQMEKFPDEVFDIFYEGAAIFFDYSYFQNAIDMLSELEEHDEDMNPDAYAMMAYSYMALGDDEQALKKIRKAVDAHAPSLAEMFADVFPDVSPAELYDYYFYKVYGRWPTD